MKTYSLAAVLILLTTVFTTTNAAPYGTTARADTPPALLREGIDKLTTFIKTGNAANQVQAMDYLRHEITPYFDFAYMTRWAAGPAWRSMDPRERAAMQSQLTQSFLTTLAQKLTTYSNQPIRYFTPRGRSGEEVTVSAWIMQPSGYPTKLDFRFYQSNSGWKIFDVKAGGNSAVVYYRNQFRDSLRHTRYARNY
ncbi:MAG: ABC transporter substrate-binding protein [Gammaproteobacteria bacterium]|nr:MAG: ABC transporter substrate-binding protein [Gammaproteobacteria bacterium]